MGADMVFPLPSDHVLGRPSIKFRKTQVFAVVGVWLLYLNLGNKHGPPGFRRISSFLSRRLSAWQTLVCTLLILYTSRNFGKLVDLECPEPLAGLYKPSYFRATWVTTALDAGFWSAMHLNKRWRDVNSIIFTLYYLVCAEQADEKVRKIRSNPTVEHLRVSWNKPLTPYISKFTWIMRPRLMQYKPRALRIARPRGSSYSDPVRGWLYYDGPISALEQQTKVVLNMPGGGFVAMSPRTHDDSLMAWAGKTGYPVLSLDYAKAPEYPYPYAVNECYDVYKSIVQSRGRCLGLSGVSVPSIVISGDSAGGNLAAAITIMILETASTETRVFQGEAPLPPPDGLVLLYPSLDVNIGNWMTDEQMSLVRAKGMRKTNRHILSRKNSEYYRMDPTTPIPTDDEADDEDEEAISQQTTLLSTSPSPPQKQEADSEPLAQSDAHAPAATTRLSGPTEPLNATTTSNERPIKRSTKRTHPTTPLTRTRIGVPSLLSYVSDRILSPSMLRTMIILYCGPHASPRFATDYLLSPALAPEAILARFPKTYFMTGERDPLVDDTAIMAARIKVAKRAAWEGREELGVLTREERRRGFVGEDHVDVELILGVSHGFLQMCGIFPEAWGYVYKVGRWYEELFGAVDRRARDEVLGIGRKGQVIGNGNGHGHASERYHHRSGTASSASGDDLDSPLEIGSSVRGKKSNGKAPRPLTVSAGSERGRSGGDGRHACEEELSPHSRSRPSSPNQNDIIDEQWGRRKSFVSLGSQDDFLERRARRLVGELTRKGPIE